MISRLPPEMSCWRAILRNDHSREAREKRGEKVYEGYECRNAAGEECEYGHSHPTSTHLLTQIFFARRETPRGERRDENLEGSPSAALRLKHKRVETTIGSVPGRGQDESGPIIGQLRGVEHRLLV